MTRGHRIDWNIGSNAQRLAFRASESLPPKSIRADRSTGTPSTKIHHGDRLPMTLVLSGILESFNKWALFGPAPAGPDAPSLICRMFLDGSRARGAS